MTYTTLISTTELAQQLDTTAWAIIDCRFWLDDTEKGRRDYRKSHIPGAIYAHLDEDLSVPKLPGVTGRHPLPPVDEFAARLGALGIGPGVQVVVYDDRAGAMAARLWWMMRWLGHEAVALLDGGFPAWLRDGLPVTAAPSAPQPHTFAPHPRPELLITTADVLARFGDPAYALFDSRAPERYRGEVEPIDPVAGHIPGAVSAPFAENLDADDNFKSTAALRSRFVTLMRGLPAEGVAFYCGSGVTSAHNVLAVAHAGLGEACLYVGSWSEWIADPERPIADR
ncbi:MAG: sulfurtransferase [Chloroflexi bacterium]|nr:sulfurtransferase [Chloroflexota bacterium]